MNKRCKLYFFLILSAFCALDAVSAKTDFSVPELKAPVMDFAGIIEDSSESELNAYITKLYDQTGIQLAVLTMRSLGGLSIEEVSIAVAEKWQLGQKGKDNGVLLTVAYEDHELRIETGYGLEGLLTDAKCSRIIRNEITPYFKASNYTQGIIQGVLKITEVVTEGKGIDATVTESKAESLSGGDVLAVIWFIFVFLLVVTTSSGLGPLGLYFWLAMLTGKPFHRRWSVGTTHHNSDDHWKGGPGGFGGFGGGGSHGGFGGGFHGGGGSSGKW